MLTYSIFLRHLLHRFRTTGEVWRRRPRTDAARNLEYLDAVKVTYVGPLWPTGVVVGVIIAISSIYSMLP